jgi:hypothetical protein
MGPNQGDALKDYSSTLEQYFTAFYGRTMTTFFHVLRFLPSSDNTNEPDNTGENYDHLCKRRTTGCPDESYPK